MTERQSNDENNQIDVTTQNDKLEQNSNINNDQVSDTQQISSLLENNSQSEISTKTDEIQNSPSTVTDPNVHVKINFESLKTNSNTAGTYQVVDGDTFESIAEKSHISTNWLKRQNSPIFSKPGFQLESGLKLNVKPPPSDMASPVRCELIRSANNNENENELGMIYFIEQFETFEFIGDDVTSGVYPICIHLLSLTGDTLQFAPKKDKAEKRIETPVLKAPQSCPNIPITPILTNQEASAPHEETKNSESDVPSLIKEDDQNEEKYDFDGIFIIDYIENQNGNLDNIKTLRFKVNIAECEEFKMHLFDSVQRIQEQQDKKKKAKLAGPRSLPERIRPNSISFSPFESMFHNFVQSVKDTFGKPATAPPKPAETNLMLRQRSFSQKTISGQVSNALKPETDLTPKPRKNEEVKRRSFAVSVISKIKLINGPSNIFERMEEVDEIRSRLPSRFTPLDWGLLYRLSKDGASYTAFYESAFNSGPVVMIISTNTHERIGTFLATGFKKAKNTYGSGESFVFRFVKNRPKRKQSSEAPKNADNEIATNNSDQTNTKNDTDANIENTNNEMNTNENIEIKDDQKLDAGSEQLPEPVSQVNDVKIDKDSPKEKSTSSIVDEPTPFAHIEVFKWNSSQNQNFISSQPHEIFIGLGDPNSIDDFAGNVNPSLMHGSAIYIGQDLLYASSNPCDTFHSPMLTRKTNFKINDIELWKVGSI